MSSYLCALGISALDRTASVRLGISMLLLERITEFCQDELALVIKRRLLAGQHVQTLNRYEPLEPVRREAYFRAHIVRESRKYVLIELDLFPNF